MAATATASCCCILLLASIAPAQDADVTSPPVWFAGEVLTRLESAVPRDVAWAGHFVQRDGRREAVPALRRALARLQEDDSIESQMARAQLLDALIRFDVRLPGEELLPHATAALRVPALILAARCPEQNTVYFETRFAALTASPDLEWRVCGNNLAALRDPHFVACCLQLLESTIMVTVVDDKQASRGVG